MFSEIYTESAGFKDGFEWTSWPFFFSSKIVLPGVWFSLYQIVFQSENDVTAFLHKNLSKEFGISMKIISSKKSLFCRLFSSFYACSLRRSGCFLWKNPTDIFSWTICTAIVAVVNLGFSKCSTLIFTRIAYRNHTAIHLQNFHMSFLKIRVFNRILVSSLRKPLLLEKISLKWLRERSLQECICFAFFYVLPFVYATLYSLVWINEINKQVILAFYSNHFRF